MVRVVLFGEDSAHQQIISPLVNRVALEFNKEIHLDWVSSVRGHGRVVQALEDYLKDLGNQNDIHPDILVVATDANCVGINRRSREFLGYTMPTVTNLVLAIPDPHIERWLLLDGAAFRTVYGRGCNAPDQKCDRNRYKQLLTQAIYQAGRQPILGGLERAADIIHSIDLDRACRLDDSLDRFITQLRSAFRQL